MACVSTTLRCLFVLLLRVLRLVVVGVLNHSFSLSVYGNISHLYSMIDESYNCYMCNTVLRSGYVWVFVCCAFFLIWGYFIIQVVILWPLLLPKNCFVILCISLSPWPLPPVKCNPIPIITLKLTLTSIRSMLILEHNRGVEQCHKCPNKPTVI